MQGSIQGTSPERMHGRAELRRLMESAIAALPETFRLVFVLREIEEHIVEEVAAMLDLNPATVKTRHQRDRRRLRAALAPAEQHMLSGTFPFAAPDSEPWIEVEVS